MFRGFRSGSPGGLALALALALSSGWGRVEGEEATNAVVSVGGVSGPVDAAWIEAQIEQLPADSKRADLLPLYQSCQELLRSAEQSRKRSLEFAAAREGVPARLQEIEDELSRPEAPESVADESLSMSRLEERSAGLEAELASQRDQLRDLEALPETRADRKIEIARRSAQVQSELRDLAQPREAAAAAATDLQRTTALEAVRKLKRMSLEAELTALTEEQRFYEANRPVVSAELQLGARQVRKLTAQLGEAQRQLQQGRRTEVDEDLTRVRANAERALRLGNQHPLLSALAETNRLLVVRRSGPDAPGARTDRMTRRLAELKQDLRSLQDSAARARSRLALIDSAGAGIDDAVGHLLRQLMLTLPTNVVSRGELVATRNEISTVLADLVQLQDALARLRYEEAVATRLTASAEPAIPAESREAVRTAVLQLLYDQSLYLERLVDDSNRLLQRLLELQVTAREVNRAVDEYERFIAERVLWIRSAPQMSWRESTDRLEQLKAYWPVPGWRAAGAWLAQSLRSDSGSSVLGLLILVGLWVGHPWLQRRRAALLDQVRNHRDAPWRLTPATMGLDALSVLRWSLLPYVLGWRMTLLHEGEHALFVRALGQALQTASLTFTVIWYLRELCRAGGTAEVHFNWSSHNVKVLRRNLAWAVLANLPLSFVVLVIEHQGFEAMVGQGVFLLQMLVILVLAHRLFRPRSGLQWDGENGEDFERVWYGRLFHALGLLLPAALGTATYLGYYYSALEIARLARLTLWAVLGCVLLRALLLRWLEVIRQTVVEQERQRHQESKAAQAEGKQPEAKPRRRFSLAGIVIQSRSLVSTSLWILFLSLMMVIWSSVFPAFRVLDRIPLPGFGGVAAARPAQPNAGPASPIALPSLPGETRAKPAAAGPSEPEPPILDPEDGVPGVSVADLLQALVIALVGWAILRNLPGLLQLLFLNRLVQPGVSYAVATLARYALGLLVVLLVCAQLGITWSNVQWIAAAFSLGIAFGLQEMFANFFSGLIILFERPIRIGDIVTVGDVSGNVTRINIRATTITDWDRREYLVPNKEFITGKLLNWTLSDPVTRVMLPVGIAYGSDTAMAERLLLEAARENPHVMTEPPPRAIFWSFGDNSLEFRLYVHILNRSNYFELLHGLTTAINRKFAEANITIAFPQRDIHLHPTQPIEVRLVSTDPPGDPGAPTPGQRPA